MSSRLQKLLAVASVMALASNAAQAQQPWWCSQPRQMNCTETVICATPQLATLDIRMSQLYAQLEVNASRRGAARLLDNQRHWLRERNRCGCNANCLVTHYSERIRLFSDVLDGR